MSGYRSLHREKVDENVAIWDVQTSPLLLKKQSTDSWRIWTAGANGFVKSHVAKEKNVQDASLLDASALTLTCTHVLLGKSQQKHYSKESKGTALGCTRVNVFRNYVGDDDAAGEMMVVSLDLSGRVRVWIFPEDMDEAAAASDDTPKLITAKHEFMVENSTGTCMEARPPRIAGVGEVLMAVACLDGTIAMVATGVATPKYKKGASTEGTIIETWGSRGSSLPMSMAWNPANPSLIAVGRQDGSVDIVGSRKNHHRLLMHETPVRAVSYTPDGHLLLVGSDDGMITIWDVSRKNANPTLVRHILQAHSSWILAIVAWKDSRRFFTCGADRKIHVWNVGQADKPLHTFQTDDTVWTIGENTVFPRLVSATETGWLQAFSLEG